MAELPKDTSLWYARLYYLGVQPADHLLWFITFVGEDNMAKKISVAAYVLILITIPILFFCSDATATIYSSISGRVIGEDTGAGLANVTVVASLLGGVHGEYQYASTDARGVYVLKDLNPGIYLISCFKEESHYLRSYPDLEVSLPNGRHVVNANYVLKLGGSVSGTVYEADGVTTLNGVRVSADVPVLQPGWIGGFAATLTDSSGKFLLQGLQESSNCVVRVRISARAMLTKKVAIEKSKTTANVNFVVKWDDITGIVGYVKSSIDDKPIKDAEIVLRDEFGNDIGSAYTDETGKYSIVGVAPGNYKAAAFWPTGEYDTVYKENIAVTSSKQTTVDIYFNAPAPISRILNWLKNLFADFLVPKAYAEDDIKNLTIDERSCFEHKDLLKKAFNSLKLLVALGSTCMDEKMSDALNKKLRERKITIYCTPASDKECTKESLSGKKLQAGGYTKDLNPDKDSIIYMCPNAFDWNKDKRICIEAVLFHELVHTINYGNEYIPIICERDCFFNRPGCFNKNDSGVQERFKDYKECHCYSCCENDPKKCPQQCNHCCE